MDLLQSFHEVTSHRGGQLSKLASALDIALRSQNDAPPADNAPPDIPDPAEVPNTRLVIIDDPVSLTSVWEPMEIVLNDAHDIEGARFDTSDTTATYAPQSSVAVVRPLETGDIAEDPMFDTMVAFPPDFIPGRSRIETEDRLIAAQQTIIRLEEDMPQPGALVDELASARDTITRLSEELAIERNHAGVDPVLHLLMHRREACLQLIDFEQWLRDGDLFWRSVRELPTTVWTSDIFSGRMLLDNWRDSPNP